MRLKATVQFKSGRRCVFKSSHRKDVTKKLVDEMKSIIKHSYQERLGAQVTIGATTINVADTSYIKLERVWL